MTGATSEAGTVYPSDAREFTPIFSGVRVARSLFFCVVFCRSLLFFLSFSSVHGVVCHTHGEVYSIQHYVG